MKDRLGREIDYMRISITDSDHALKIGKMLNLGRTGLFCTGAFFAACSFIAVIAFYKGLGASNDKFL